MSVKKYTFIVVVIIFLYVIIRFNSVFIQTFNTKYLIEIDQSSRVFPHRVNSIGKLHDVWEDGFRSFEVDVIYGYNDSNAFQVGHDQSAIGNTDLEGLLLSVDYKNIQRIWLDLKNLKSNNYTRIIERLEYLDDKYGIKNKTILESGTKLPLFKIFSENNWHTSYYLPTNIINYINVKDDVVLNNIASRIAQQAEIQKLSAVSFDNRLNFFVGRYLEPLISNNIVYHTWMGPALKKINFRSRLLIDDQYLDSRVKTILIPYKSRHNI